MLLHRSRAVMALVPVPEVRHHRAPGEFGLLGIGIGLGLLAALAGDSVHAHWLLPTSIVAAWAGVVRLVRI